MPAAVGALALGGFGIGLTEFIIAGLLPPIGADMHIGEAAAGLLISGYALAVAVGAFAVTIATARMRRRTVLLLLVGLFVAGNLLCALAPTYGLLLVGRVVAALCHGAFFGTGAVVAASIVGAERRNRAIAVMFGGLTVANVAGVPLGTFVGERFGWRATFGLIVIVGVAVLIAVRTLVPPDAGGASRLDLRAEIRALFSKRVWLSLGITVFGFGGMFGAFSLLSYTLTRSTGLAIADMPWILLIFGVGLVAGNVIGGRTADRHRDLTIGVALVVLVATMVTFALLADLRGVAVAMVFLMGAAGFAIAPGVQSRVLDAAPGAATLASSANIAAFNAGNALGAWIGSTALSAGFAATAPLWTGAAMTMVAVALLGVSTLTGRTRTTTGLSRPAVSQR